MKKQNLVITTITILSAAVALTGCANQKSSAASVTSDVTKTAKIVKKDKKSVTSKVETKQKPSTEKITNSTNESTNVNANVESATTVVSSTVSSASNEALATSVTVQPTTSVQVQPAKPTKEQPKAQEVQVVKEEAPAVEQVLDLDATTKVQLVNVAMGYVSEKNKMPEMSNGYWEYAKATWGISDAQVLVKTSTNVYQIFSQGAEQYSLTINGNIATLVSRSNYTQTTKTVTIDINSMTITGSTF